MSEILHGIKVLKLYAWEPSFANIINGMSQQVRPIYIYIYIYTEFHLSDLAQSEQIKRLNLI